MNWRKKYSQLKLSIKKIPQNYNSYIVFNTLRCDTHRPTILTWWLHHQKVRIEFLNIKHQQKHQNSLMSKVVSHESEQWLGNWLFMVMTDVWNGSSCIINCMFEKAFHFNTCGWQLIINQLQTITMGQQTHKTKEHKWYIMTTYTFQTDKDIGLHAKVILGGYS